MSPEPVRRANLAAIACDPRPQLPDGFRRNSKRVGSLLGAACTGLSVYAVGGRNRSSARQRSPPGATR
jgi:hypothetical protein